MKIIDQKGKLFGLINIIDLCVLLIIVLLVGFGGYKVLNGKMDINVPGSGSSQKDILVTAKVYGIRTAEVSDGLKKGDELISLTSKSGAFIESATSVQSDDVGVNNEGQNVPTKNPLKYDITIVFKMKADPNATMFKLGSQDVAVGKGFIVKTQKVEIQSVVQKIEIK